MDTFEYTAGPARVIFGAGVVKQLPQEVRRLSASRPLLLCTPGSSSRADHLSSLLAEQFGSVPRFDRAAMHTPVAISDDAVAYVNTAGADCVISVGGGSTVGLGKAIKFRTGLPHISVPTTYSGSEMTAMLGETKDGVKKTIIDDRVRVNAVIYDPDLTMSLPPSLSATSGVNAIAHAVEALYSRERNPIISLFAKEGIRALARALPQIVEDSSNKSARIEALYGAWLCSMCAGSVSMALHHKLCHTLGGSFKLPHAETHTVVLPHALSYNAPEIPEQMAVLAEVLPDSNGDAVHGLNILLTKLKVGRSLKQFGMKSEDIERGAELAASNPYWNPRPIERETLNEVIRRCWAGEEAKQDL